MFSLPQIRRFSAVAIACGVLLLGACGGDDDDKTTISTPAGDVEVDLDDGVGSDIDTEALQDATDIEGVLDATGLETKGFALKSAMGAEDFEVDGTTLVLTFDKDGVESAPVMDCMIAGAIVDDGDTVQLVYNDGEHTCD